MPSEPLEVLIVDDDEPVRRIVSLALRSAGYAVLAAADGAEALALLDGQARGARVLLTDIQMPGMDGLELARRVRQVNPEIQIVYMTGFSDRTGEPGCAILHKPFTPASLKQVVAAAAARPPNGQKNATG